MRVRKTVVSFLIKPSFDKSVVVVYRTERMI